MVTNIKLAPTDGDPSNYLTYFKRAAVYLAIGQAKKAIPDLNKSIELKKDFHQVPDSRVLIITLGRYHS